MQSMPTLRGDPGHCRRRLGGGLASGAATRAARGSCHLQRGRRLLPRRPRRHVRGPPRVRRRGRLGGLQGHHQDRGTRGEGEPGRRPIGSARHSRNQFGTPRRALAQEYARLAIEVEWPARPRAFEPRSRAPVLEKIWRTVTESEGTEAQDDVLRAQFFQHFSALSDARQSPLVAAGESLPWVMWSPLIGGRRDGRVHVFSAPNAVAQYIMTALYAASFIVILLVFISLLDLPLRGDLTTRTPRLRACPPHAGSSTIARSQRPSLVYQVACPVGTTLRRRAEDPHRGRARLSLAIGPGPRRCRSLFAV